MSSNIKKINEDFSVTDKFHTYIGNEYWKQGYNELVNGEYNYTNDGKIDLNNSAGYFSLWTTLSACFEPVTSEIYEKISNMVMNVRDISTADINELKSLSEELGIKDINLLNVDYPSDIGKLIQIFSIPMTKTVLTEQILLSDSLEDIYNDASINIAGTGIMGGYDITGDFWSDDEKTNIEALSGTLYEHITKELYTQYIKNELSACIIDNLNIDGIINDIKLYQSDPLLYSTTPEDDDELNELKTEYFVDKNFSVIAEADKVQDGITLIEDYKTNQQYLINYEIDRRANKEKYGNEPNTFRKYRYEKERIVKKYISLVENINNYQNTYTERSDNVYELDDFVTSGFFDTPELSGQLITNAVDILTDECFKISYQREYLRRVGQRNILIGTNKLIKDLISTFIVRNIYTPERWNYTSPFRDNILSGLNENELSGGFIGEIDVVEYYDSTEYMNIETGVDEYSIVNPRYWEEDTDTLESQSQHSYEDIVNYFKQYDLDITTPELSGFLDYNYDMGAAWQTTEPTFETIPSELPVEGTFGTYGYYSIVSGETLDVYIEKDIEPLSGYSKSSNYNDWINSPFLSGYEEIDMLTNWATYPNVNSWYYNLDISVDGTTVDVTNGPIEFSNIDSVSAYIHNTFGTTGYVQNLNYNNWKSSPLLISWWDEEFETEWSKNQDINYWTHVNTMLTGDFGWRDNSLVIDYATSLGHSTVDSITQAQWTSSYFVRSWNTTPFDTNIVDIDFTYEEDWVSTSNPFISGWVDTTPYNYIITNNLEITGDSATGLTEIEAKELLYSNGAIPAPDGGIDSTDLSGMHRKYLGDDTYGYEPYYNIKNNVHPSISYHPFMWNLVEIISQKVGLPAIYSFIVQSDNTLKNVIREIINSNGFSSKSWRIEAIDLNGYQTFYEYSNNIDRFGNFNEKIEYDGPFYPDALSAYLDDPDDFISNKFNTYYGHLSITEDDISNIKYMLSSNYDAINSLSTDTSGWIYDYATDKCDNHYTLYKSNNDSFDESGKIWMRYKNHPISFPLNLDFSDEFQQVIATDMSQIEDYCNNCFKMKILNIDSESILCIYGGNESDSNLRGKLYTARIMKNDEDYKVNLSGLPISSKRIQNIDISDRFVDVYKHNSDLVIVINNDINDLDNRYTINNGNGTYTIRFSFISYNISTGIRKAKTIDTILDYDEYKYDSESILNNIKLNKSNNTVSILIPLRTPNLLYSKGSSDLYIDYMDETNYSDNFYKNIFGIAEYNLSENISIPDSYSINYYADMGKVGYHPLFSNNGVLTDSYEFDYNSEDCVNIQYFGYQQELSAEFKFENNRMVIYDTSGDLNVTLNEGNSYEMNYSFDEINNYTSAIGLGSEELQIYYDTDYKSHLLTVCKYVEAPDENSFFTLDINNNIMPTDSDIGGGLFELLVDQLTPIDGNSLDTYFELNDFDEIVPKE